MRNTGLALALLLSAPALAQNDADDTAQSDWDGAPITAAEPFAPAHSADRWSVLTKYGDETCPEPEPDEILVCATLPETERYRVPAALRGRNDTAVGGQSWGARVAGYEDIARQTRPDSCSPVGSYGFSGCAAAALRQWFAERRASQ
jgi:hypothetical protein